MLPKGGFFILINKTIAIKLNTRHIKHFESLGYIIPRCLNKNGELKFKNGTKLFVKTHDLPLQSNIMVDIICDYCGIGYKSSLDNRYKYYNKGNIQKDCCLDCGKQKRKESNIKVYGIENTSQLNEVKEKMFETNLIKYGCKMPPQNNKIKNKIKQTSLKNFGETSPSKSEQIKEKIKNTCMKKYGVSCVLKDKDTQDKIRNTNIEKYGVENPSQNKTIKDKIKQNNLLKYGVEFTLLVPEIREKSSISLYKNGTCMCSKQQRYVHSIIGGELNYPIDRLNLDIAFLEDKIYVEWDGSGHDLSVKTGSITKKEFEQKEIKRYLFLKSLGWKQIRFISLKDFVPMREDLLKIIQEAKNKLLSNQFNHLTIILDRKNPEYNLIKL